MLNENKSEKKQKHKKEKKKLTGTKKALIVLAVLLGIVLIVVFSFSLTVKHYLGKINRVSPDDVSAVHPSSEDFETDEEPGGEKLSPDDVKWTSGLPRLSDDPLINIMLVGQDRREGQGRQRSDTMILCSINTDTKQISLISFMRDLYVQIPGGYSDNRLNATYAFGGFPLLDETLTHNFGFSIDGNFEVDFGGFISVIDVLGGVDITMTEVEANTLLGSGAGTYHLNGEKALNYARLRSTDSDFNRTERQRNVLTAVFTKIRGMSVTQIMGLLDAILPTLTTDMQDSEIISLVRKVAPLLSGSALTSHRVPANDAYYSANISGMSVLVPDVPLIREQLLDYLPLG